MGVETETTKLAEEVANLHTELDSAKEKLAKPAIKQEDMDRLRSELKRSERMLDNALRLQTRAEIGWKNTQGEASQECSERRRVEAMMRQLMDRLEKLKSPVSVRRSDVYKRASQYFGTRHSQHPFSNSYRP